MLALAPLVTAQSCGPGPYAENAAGADAAAAVGVLTTMDRVPAVVSSEAGMVANNEVVGPTQRSRQDCSPDGDDGCREEICASDSHDRGRRTYKYATGGQTPPGAMLAGAAAMFSVTLTATLLLAAVDDAKTIVPV